jgi:hypothetical protein
MPATVTLGQAAKTSGLSKQAITNAIKAGILPATRNDGWTYQIDSDALRRLAAGPSGLVEAAAQPERASLLRRELTNAADGGPSFAARMWGQIRSRFAA